MLDLFVVRMNARCVSEKVQALKNKIERGGGSSGAFQACSGSARYRRKKKERVRIHMTTYALC